jgi:proprotein convertase subtilisin/kexin type 5
MFRSLNSSNACACIAGYYDSGVLICNQCQIPCSNCVGGSVLNCTSCITGYILIGSSCMPSVNCANFYFEGKCLSSCPNTTYDNGMRICINCINNCLTCNSAISCTSCKNGYYFQNNSCHLICPSNTYVNRLNGSCTNCPAECLSCALRNNSIICLSCNTGYYLNSS